MKKFRIGIMSDWLGLPFRQAVEKSAELGAEGIQIYTTSGEMAPENLTPGRRREILDIIRSNGLVVSALCGDLGHGFGDEAMNPALIEKSMRIMDLAKDLGAEVVTTHIGAVPEDEQSGVYAAMQSACDRLGEYGDGVGASFAVETGPEPAAALAKFLRSLRSGGVRVNFDPANLVMCMGEVPAESVKILAPWIVHTHAKDGRMISKIPNRYEELPLGQGDVDFGAYLKALAETGYSGFLTIEREVGANPAADIAMAVGFLKERMEAL